MCQSLTVSTLALMFALPIAAADPPPATVHIALHLQGFNPPRVRKMAAMEAMEKRITALPGVSVSVSEDGGFESTGFYRAEIDFDPSKANLGDLAKAAAAGGARARLMLYTDPAYEKPTLTKAIAALAKVKGVSEPHCPWGGHILVITLKPGGGGKLDEVLAALKTANTPARTTRKD